MNQDTTVVSAPQTSPPKKRDAAARWRRLLEDQRASGLPISAFCRQRGIPASSLFFWRRKLGAAGRAAERAGFAAVAVTGHGGGGDSGVSIELPGGLRVMVRRDFDRRLLREVIDALCDVTPSARGRS